METVADLNRRITSLPQGLVFTRLAIALMRCAGDLPNARDLAKSWNDSPQVHSILNAMCMLGSSDLKSAVAAGDSVTSGWASQLVYYDNAVAEFVDLLRPASIVGRLNLHRVPQNVRFGVQGSGALIAWTGNGYPMPAQQLSLSTDSIGAAKAAGLMAITKELAGSSAPDAQRLIRNEFVRAVAQFVDQQFISPGIAAVADVSPASITHGAPSIVSTGSSVSAIAADFKALFQVLVDAGITFTSPALIMSPTVALALALKRDANGGAAFPTINVGGGALFGVPVITSANVPGSVSGGSIVVLVDAAELFYVEGTLTLDASEQACVQLVTNPGTGAQSLVSLFQSHLVGLRVVAFRNWKVRRAGAVAFIDQVAY